MDEQSFRARLAETAAAAERDLEDVLALEPKVGERARPRRLIEAMRYAALGGGKRLRPFLVIESARGGRGAKPARNLPGIWAIALLRSSASTPCGAGLSLH